MPDEEITTEESLTETEPSGTPAPVSEPAVSKVEGLTLDELNAFTGKNFPTKESALKSIKDTYKAVVSKPTAVDHSQFVSKAEFEEATFYARHPEYETQKEIISALSARSGKSVSEVVESDTFKSVFNKVKTADELEASKSVLHSHPRLGQVTDKMTQARDALKTSKAAAKDGDLVAAEQAYQAGASAAVNAVMEAYSIGR